MATLSSLTAQNNKDGGLEMVYDPPEKEPANVGSNGLCTNAPMTVTIKRADMTIGTLAGAEIQGIKVHYYAKRWGEFAKVQAHLKAVLAAKSQDGAVYQYQPWAEAAPPCIIATIEYKKGKGELEVGGVGAHVCFQDDKGVHWWARLPFAPPLPFK